MRFLKPFFLALLVLPFFQNLDAQTCKYEVEEVDKFTKSKKLVTKNVSLWNPGNGNSFGIKGKYESGQVAFLCRYVFDKPYSIETGADIIFLFDDGEALTLNVQGGSEAKSAEAKLLYGVNFTLVVNEEQQAIFAEKTITDIRITAKERNFDRPIKAVHGKRVQEILKCLE